ncbi:ribonuclease H-like domain-containing protein [Tanacetum coccineum]
MGHRRWIEPNHSSRKDTRSFDGHQELRQPPILASGDDILDQLKGVDFLSENVEKSPWKKKSIFFMLLISMDMSNFARKQSKTDTRTDE